MEVMLSHLIENQKELVTLGLFNAFLVQRVVKDLRPPVWATLRQLCLDHLDSDTTTLHVLKAMEHGMLINLQALSLILHTTITSTTIASHLAQGACPNLTFLKVAGESGKQPRSSWWVQDWALGPMGGVMLCQSIGMPHSSKLAFIDMSHSSIGDGAVGVLASSLSFCPQLRGLHLEDVSMTSEGLDQLVDSLATGICKHLESLVLRGNPIGDEGIIALSLRLLQGDGCLKHLNCLDLHDTDMSNEGGTALYDALTSLDCHLRLQSLYLSENKGLGDIVLVDIIEAVLTHPLKRLTLAWTKMGGYTVKRVMEGLLAQQASSLPSQQGDKSKSRGWSELEELSLSLSPDALQLLREDLLLPLVEGGFASSSSSSSSSSATTSSEPSVEVGASLVNLTMTGLCQCDDTMLALLEALSRSPLLFPNLEVLRVCHKEAYDWKKVFSSRGEKNVVVEGVPNSRGGWLHRCRGWYTSSRLSLRRLPLPSSSHNFLSAHHKAEEDDAENKEDDYNVYDEVGGWGGALEEEDTDTSDEDVEEEEYPYSLSELIGMSGGGGFLRPGSGGVPRCGGEDDDDLGGALPHNYRHDIGTSGSDGDNTGGRSNNDDDDRDDMLVHY